MSKQKNPWAWGQPYVEGGAEPDPAPPAQPLEAPPVEPLEEAPTEDDFGLDTFDSDFDDDVDGDLGDDGLSEQLPKKFTSHSAAERWLEVNDLEAPEGWENMTLAGKRAALANG